MKNLTIESRSISKKKLISLIPPDITSEYNIRIANETNTRGIDPSIIVASIGASSMIIGTLIGGFLNIKSKANIGKIVIEGKEGRRIEFPTDTPPEKIEELLKAAKSLDLDNGRIILSRD